MTVLKFPVPQPRSHGWHPLELQQFTHACAPSAYNGEISGWDIGTTELGEPQLYVVGQPPHYDCDLVASRIGTRYVLEDGAGTVLFEHADAPRLAARIRAMLRRRRTALVARVTVAWCAIRELFEEKIEPIMAEPLEVLSHSSAFVVVLA